ncbi:MAG: HAD-IIA family hydrolase [Chromatiales bacterium]
MQAVIHSSPPAAVLLDMDGVLYHGEQAIIDAIGFVDALSAIPHAFITNNPIRTPLQVAERLQRLGFPRPAEQQIVTSAEVTAQWLQAQKPGFRYFAVGGNGLHIALQQYGVADTQQADFVVIGEGEGLDYENLTIGINLILQQQAQLIATNPDESVDATDHNGRHLVLPGGGALVAPFAVATGVQPLFIGKPHALLFEQALSRLGLAAQQCLMIGDRPDTDIKGAALLGMQTALVRSGRFAPGQALPADCPAADFDVENLQQLEEQLRKFYPDWLAPVPR